MGPGIYAFAKRGKEKRGAREPGGAGLHRRRECVQSAFRTGSTPSGGSGTGPIFPGPGAIGRSGTGIRPGPMMPGAGATGGVEPRTGGWMPTLTEVFWIVSTLAFAGASPGTETTAGATIGWIGAADGTRPPELTTVESRLGGVTTGVPADVTVADGATGRIAIVFSAGATSPGRADTARAFNDRNKAPRRSSVPMAVVFAI